MTIDQQKIEEILKLIHKRYPDWDGFSHQGFVKDEIEYKQATISKARELLSQRALKQLLEESRFDEFIDRLDKIGKDNNLLYLSVPMSGDLNILYQPELDKPGFCQEIFKLLYGVGSTEERLTHYVNYVEAHNLPNKWTFPTYFLFICHPDTEMFVKPMTTKRFVQFTGDVSKFTAKPTSSAYAYIKQLSRQIKDILQEYGAKDMVDVQSFIWTCASVSRKYNFKGSRYWKIAPGEKAWNWEECRENGFITIGWEDLGDISQLSRSEFNKRRDERVAQYPDWTKEGVEQVWKFSRIKEGDRIVANRGTTEVLGIGTVTGPYYFVSGVEHGHRLPVEWDDTVPRRVDEYGWRRTLIELDREKFDAILNAPSIGEDIEFESIERQHSEEAVRSVFERFYSDLDERKICATLLADSIVHADKLNRSGWEVTLRQNDIIRLNVGRIEAMALYPGKVYMVLDSELLNEAERQKFKDVLKFSDSEYVSVPGEKAYGSIPSAKLLAVLDDLKPAYFRLIEKASQSATRTPFYWAHSSGILKYLRNFLQRELPDPDYGDVSVPDSREVQKESEIVQNPEYTLEQCADKTGFELPMIEKWVRAIERKKQAIFYGPPGTGKTYIAEQLARHLIGGGDGFIEIVQFHPAYAYEDFIQGIRPKARDDGGLDYPTIPGRFLEFCREAQARNDRCALIIDEINRANLARVFGELMYLLEYRDRRVPLAGGNTLSIPENVRIIGTMNTADRSIALVDYALRRRFAFLALSPNYSVLHHYHERKQTGFAVDGLIKVLKQLNRQIGDPHYEVGISFFLHENLSEVIEDIWRMEIEPYLEEFFFDQPAKVEEFRWEKKREEILS